MPTSHHAQAWAWDQDCRSAGEKLVLLALAAATGGDENDARVCWPSIARIATQTGVSESLVKRHMVNLVETGKITKVERRVRANGTFGSWKLTVNFTTDHGRSMDEPTTDHGRSVGHRPPVVSHEPAISEPAKKNMRDGSFDEFWQGYPKARRIGKPAALRAWSRVTAKERLEVMLGLSLWAIYWEKSKTENSFIPYPQKWLNERRWENPPEPEPVPVVVIRPCIMCAAPNPREECNGPNYIGPDFDMTECPWRQ